MSSSSTSPDASGIEPRDGFELFIESRPPGLVRRLLTTYRHLVGLLLGGLAANLREGSAVRRRRFGMRLLRLVDFFSRRLVRRDLVALPFAVQLRRRLELLGPTYIKLGQVLALRRDLLPANITDELENLLGRLPAVPFERFSELVREGLGRDPATLFKYIESRPLGSASIGQIHRAGTFEGDAVILKVVKPGIREILSRDVVLLRFLGRVLQLFFGRFQPRRIVDEFCHYTLLEVDLSREADNAETFAANFRDQPDIRFPRVYRKYSSSSVLCLEYLRGIRPDAPEARKLPAAERQRVVDLGASAIIRMLYQDGFFHADLHPGNLLLLPGGRCGFLDLGMVGRFDEELRRGFLYYYYCLVTGDSENAARYLAALAAPGPRSDSVGFRREVEEVCRRWHLSASFSGISLGQLILESVQKGARYRIYFPVELVLMVKAIVTFEAVGQMLAPGFDVAEVSKKHLTRILLQQLSPFRLAQEAIRNAPELVDALAKAPALVIAGLRALEQAGAHPRSAPTSGLRSPLLSGFSLVAGAILLAFDGPPAAWGALFGVALVFAFRR